MADAGDVRRMRAVGELLERWGVTVRWMPGWDRRGETWPRVPVGIIDHHDAAPLSSGEWGALNDITVNTKAQFQVARCLDGEPKVAITAAGICWHAGVGSWRFPDGLSVPRDSGNYWLYGAEKANNGLGEPYNDAAIYAADALFAAVLDVCGNLPASRVVGHKEYGNQPNGWPGRKTDPSYSMDWRRRRVASFKPRTGAAGGPTPPRPPKPAPKPKEGWLMALSDKEQDELLAKVREIHGGLFDPVPRQGLRDGDVVREASRLRKIDYMDDARLRARPEPAEPDPAA